MTAARADGLDDEREPRDYPVAVWQGGIAIPDLSRIDSDRWREVLEPLPLWHREVAARTAGERQPDAAILAIEIELEGPSPRERASQAAAGRLPVPRPTAEGARPEEGRQCNFRLSAGQYEKLGQAARLLGLKPTQLARSLVVNGVHRMLAEAAREVRNAP